MKRFVVLVSLSVIVCLQAFTQDVNHLLQKADSLMRENNVQESLKVYQDVLSLDVDNYQALVFMTNYYYLLGAQRLQKVDAQYLKIKSPSRMQEARYDNDLKDLYETYFKFAETYLVKAYLISRNDYLDKIAGDLYTFKERIGLHVPPLPKTPLLKRLLP